MKKYIVLFMVVFLFSLSTSISYANKQSSLSSLTINDITYNEIVDPLTGVTTKRPIVRLSWVSGPNSFEPDTREGIVNGDQIHNVESYEIYIRNMSKTGNKTLLAVVPAATTSYDVGTNIWLESGNLYEFQVIPVHYHNQTINTVTTSVKADYVVSDLENHTKVIGLTDHNIRLTANGKEIDVVWEDAGSWVNYDIYYGSGEIRDYINMAGRIQNVRGDSTSFVDANDNKIKLRYTIRTSDIKAGQLYSVCVRPIVTNINGKSVYINPRTNAEEVNTKIPFKASQESDQYVKLAWWGIDTSIGITGEPDLYSIKELQVIRKDYNSAIEQIIARLEGTDAINIGYYSDLRPQAPTNYRINIVYSKIENGIERTLDMSSEWALYDPGAIRITPAKPEVPELNDILSKDDNDIVNPLNYDGTFKIDKINNSINLVWSAFERIDYGNENQTERTFITDLDVYYDIWLTDDISIIYGGNNLCIDKDYAVSPTEGVNVKYIMNRAEKVIGFSKEYTRYVAAVKENGLVKGYELKNIEDNKIYYIKIVAKKLIENEILRSEPVILSVYFDSDDVIYAPPVLPKPPLKIKELGMENISLEWRLSWWEVVSISDPAQVWYNKVWLQDGDILFSKVTGAEEIVLNTRENVNNLIARLSEENRDNYSFRQISLGNNVQYEMMVIPYANVEATILDRQRIDPAYDLEDYVNSIKDTTGEENGWITIMPTVDTNDLGRQTLYYNEDDLLPNTSYMFVIKPFKNITVGNKTEKLYSLNPTTLIATTLITDDVILPEPTVPDLYAGERRDIELDLKWTYNTKMKYDIKINEREELYTARDYKFELPARNDPNYPRDGQDFVLTIKDLLPKTEYYFWIRASQKEGDKISTWSNALLVKTTDILPNPINPPDGIGIAAVDNPIGENYITVEWTRLVEDLESEVKNKTYTVKKLFSYVFVISDNVKFLDSKQIEIEDSNVGQSQGGFEVLGKSLLKVNGLEPNKKYYFKIKSVVRAVKGNSINSVKSESNFSEVKSVKTSATTEYDSEAGELDIPLPDKITKRYENEVLTYTIADADRVITDILRKDDNHFVIDLTEYKTGSSASTSKKINKRVIEAPYNVINTLIQQKMNLDILTDDMSIIIPASAFETPVLGRARQIGGLKNYVITITNDSNIKNNNGARMSKSKSIKAVIQTKHGALSESYFKDSITILYNYATNTNQNDVLTNVYRFDTSKNKWVYVTEQIKTNDGNIIIRTKYFGDYGIGIEN